MSMRKFISAASVAALAAATAITAVPAYAGQTGAGPGSIINCDASGNRQAYGAILGAIGGAILGNNVSKGEDAPLVGAAAGAAAGSYIGCQQQRTISRAEGRGVHFATTRVNVRAGPSTQYGSMGQLVYGQRVNVYGYRGEWAAVDLGNDNTGYVHSAYLAPVNR
jgi:uncharacterized protein YgiM (DUF1202 family)